MKTRRKPNQVPASLKNINLGAVLRRNKIYQAQEKWAKAKNEAMPIARSIVAVKKKPIVKVAPKTQRHAQFTNEVLQEYWEKQIHIVDVVEQKFENKVQQFIEKVSSSFLDHLDQEVKKDFFDDNEEDLVTQAVIDFAPLLDTVAVLAGNEANKLIGIKEPYLGTNLKSKILDNIQFFTKSMLDTDRDHLATIIANGLKDGKSIPELRGMIQEDFSQFSKMQATRITRTEVLRASVDASLDAYQESGVVEGKQWLTAGADDECASYEGEIVSLSDDFADGDPPLHPNCRCVLLPVLANEKTYVPSPNKAMASRIKELEDQIDKRTKEFKEIKQKALEDQATDKAYITALEKYLKVEDEQA